MKILILSLLIIQFFPLAQAQDMRAGEQRDMGSIDSRLQDYFAHELSNTYQKSFDHNLKKYNQTKRNVNDIIKANPNLSELFLKKAHPYRNEKLPPITKSAANAIVSIGKNKIIFSAHTLMDGYVFVNDQKVFLTEVDQANLPLIRTYTHVESIFTKLFIPQAHADTSDKFEVLILSTLIAIKDDFDSSWCLFDSCREQRAKRNFEKVMHEISLQSIKCQMNDASFTLSRELDDYTSSQMSLALKDKLVDQFHSYPQSELTCQKLVEQFRPEEVKQRTSRIERRGYGGVDSFTAEQNKEQNHKDFSSYIKDVCAPYVELRNCLIDKHPDTRAVHDRAREHNRRGQWKNYPDEYQVLPRGQGIPR